MPVSLFAYSIREAVRHLHQLTVELRVLFARVASDPVAVQRIVEALGPVGRHPARDHFVGVSACEYRSAYRTRFFFVSDTEHVRCIRRVFDRHRHAVELLLLYLQNPHISVVDIHFVVEDRRAFVGEHRHGRNVRRLRRTESEHPRVIDQIQVVLHDVVLEFFLVERAVSETFDERMSVVSVPDLLNCGKQPVRHFNIFH